MINPENICLLTSFSHLPIRRDSSQRPQGTWTGRTAPWHSCSARFDKWSEICRAAGWWWHCTSSIGCSSQEASKRTGDSATRNHQTGCWQGSADPGTGSTSPDDSRTQNLLLHTDHHPHRMAGNRHTQTHEPNRSAITWASSSGNIKM